MERRGEDRDSGYHPPESPLKLPLAPIVSTPPDRRGANVPRRGSAIFSPTQTFRFKPPSPDPDPSTGGPSNSTTPASPPHPAAPPPHSVRYRECLKNHAASMGGHVVDGCGEFMPNGEEGTVEALRCAACDCHRNFHRKEVEGEAQPSNRAPLVAGQRQGFAAAMVSFGGNNGGDESSSEDLNMSGGHAVMQASSRKRFRTKFSQEQKDAMQELAEKLGWRIQKQDEEQVQRFCNETGVKRQVFKVWMHNNKQAIKKRLG